MGVDYALVHDETEEAFDLGKSLGWQWSAGNDHLRAEYPFPPPSRDAVRAFIVEHYEEETPHIDAVADAIWRFIEAHPGCYVVSDTGDHYWTPRAITDEDRRVWFKAFREIGSRYDVIRSEHVQRATGGDDGQ